jgi:hypothetical protein
VQPPGLDLFALTLWGFRSLCHIVRLFASS